MSCQESDLPSKSNENGVKIINSCYDDGTDTYKHLDQRYAYVFDLANTPYSKEDSKRLVHLLKNTLNFYTIDFEVSSLEDLTAKLSNVGLSSTPDEDSVFVVLLYHCSMNNVNNLVDVWKHLLKYHNLATKPKIFLFVEYHNPVTIDHGGENEELLHIPSHSDFLLVHGFGNEYVRVLCDVVGKCVQANIKDIISMVTYTQFCLHSDAQRNKQNNGAPSISESPSKASFFNNLLTHDMLFKLALDNDNKEKDYDKIVEDRRRIINCTEYRALKALAFIKENDWSNLSPGKKGYVESAKASIEKMLRNPPVDPEYLDADIATAECHIEKKMS